jgi:polar amino acid transport system substrate-binding protein
LKERITDNFQKGKNHVAKKVVIAITLMALFVAACSQPTPAPTIPTTPPEPALTPILQDDSWQKVQEAGVLRVGTSADYPPFESYDENHNFVGFDIALIQQLGQKLGLKVEINDFAFDGLPMAVASGQIDVVISALSVTPERQSIANFSNVYYASTDAVLSRPEAEPQKIQDPAALAAARLVFNSTHHDL